MHARHLEAVLLSIRFARADTFSAYDARLRWSQNGMDRVNTLTLIVEEVRWAYWRIPCSILSHHFYINATGLRLRQRLVTS